MQPKELSQGREFVVEEVLIITDTLRSHVGAFISRPPAGIVEYLVLRIDLGNIFFDAIVTTISSLVICPTGCVAVWGGDVTF